ncbi:hypothetical protein D3C77_402060 [compost metagenome]
MKFNYSLCGFYKLLLCGLSRRRYSKGLKFYRGKVAFGLVDMWPKIFSKLVGLSRCFVDGSSLLVCHWFIIDFLDGGEV